MRVAVWAVMGFGPVAARADLFGVGGAPATNGYPTLLRYSPQGEAIGPFPSVDPPRSEEFGSLTRGPDGNLYFLGNILGGGSIWRVATMGAGSLTLLYADSGPPADGKLFSPAGIGFDSAGRLYVTSHSTRSPPRPPTQTSWVYQLEDPETLTPVYGVPPTGQLQFEDVEFDAADAMYVGIYNAGIRKVNADGGVPFTIPTTSLGDFKFGPDGKLYVASRTAGVLRYDPSNGAALGAFVAPGAGGLVSASYMAFGDDGTLYVNDRTATAIFKFDAATGAPLGVFVDYEARDGTDGPHSIAYVNVPEPGGVALCAAAVWLTARRGDRSRRARRGRPVAG